MKKVFIAVLMFFPVSVFAGQITLPLTAESESKHERYCYYENSNYSFSYEVPLSRSCPFTRTFDTDDED